MVTIEITNGPSVQIAWRNNMNGQNAIEETYNKLKNDHNFTFQLEYYGNQLGYLINMINGTYDSFNSSKEPFFFWDFVVNGISSVTGIDNTSINDDDIVTFTYTIFNAASHAETTLGTKFLIKSI